MKNKRADIANFLWERKFDQRITFPRKVKSKSEYLFFANKRADIAVTILVVAVVVLCAAALFSFYAGKSKIGRTVNSVYFLQDAYNLAESVRYSGIGLADKYDGQNYNVDYDFEKEKYSMERTYYLRDLGVGGLGVNADEEVLKIKYVFKP